MSTKARKKNGEKPFEQKPPKKITIKRLAYTEVQIISAIRAVEENGMAKAEAARTFNVPKTTLLDKLVGRTPRGRKMGHPPYLTCEEEQDIVQLVSLF